MSFEHVVELVGRAVEVAGIAVIVVGSIVASVNAAQRHRRGVRGREAFRRYRHGIGRAILLGLELLVAGDIIRTVAVSPSFTTVGVLAVIVLIRTFLSFSLEAELEGQWPWQRRPDGARAGER